MLHRADSELLWGWHANSFNNHHKCCPLFCTANNKLGVMKKISARRRIYGQPLSGALIHQVMRKLFPKRNDYGSTSFDDLVPELVKHGINTRGKFQNLMTHNRRILLRMDRDPLYLWERKLFAEEYGEGFIRDAERRQYWFAYPALIRVAVEMEFGEAAEVEQLQPVTPVDPRQRPSVASAVG